MGQTEFLVTALKAWSQIAQPFQLSAAARGSEHEDSRRLCINVRGLAVDLHNTAGFTAAAERIASAMREVFAALGRVAAMVDDDLAKLASLREDARKAETAHLEWENSVRFEGAYGLVFKNKVSVSVDGVRFNRRFIALSDVSERMGRAHGTR